MRSLKEIMRSNRRFEILGGRTPEENAAHWQAQWKMGLGNVWPHGPGTEQAHETFPEAYDYREHLSRCAVPPNICDILAGKPDDRPAMQTARRWIETDQSFLLFHGEPRCGKSVAASSIFEAAHETVLFHGGEIRQWDSHNCWFLGAPELARLSYYDAEGRQVVEHLKWVRLLVLDDLGTELLSPGYLSTIDEVLNARFGDKRKRTVLTGNVSGARTTREKPSDFEARYGARLAGRIRESGTVFRVEAA